MYHVYVHVALAYAKLIARQKQQKINSFLEKWEGFLRWLLSYHSILQIRPIVGTGLRILSTFAPWDHMDKTNSLASSGLIHLVHLQRHLRCTAICTRNFFSSKLLQQVTALASPGLPIIPVTCALGWCAVVKSIISRICFIWVYNCFK